MVRRKRAKRGIVLLVVLSLLVLFVVIAATFAVVASQYRIAAEINQRAEIKGDRPDELLDKAMYQLVRDTSDLFRSSIRGHSLLRDLYGDDSVDILIEDVHEEVHGQIVRLEVFSSASLSDTPDYYNGRVLTILDNVFTQGADGGWGIDNLDDNGNSIIDEQAEAGWPGSDDEPTKSYSTRVVRYEPEIPAVPPLTPRVPPRFWVEAFESELPGKVMPAVHPGSPNSQLNGGIEPNGHPLSLGRARVNGRVFNGTGAGFTSVTDNLDQSGHQSTAGMPTGFVGLPPMPVAFMPHLDGRGFGISPNLPRSTGTAAPYGLGGLDESYDAVDLENMFLSLVPTASNTFPPLTGPPQSYEIIPSFHRPALIRYWYEWVKTNLLAPLGVTDEDAHRRMFLYPYGPDKIRGTADDPIDSNFSWGLPTNAHMTGGGGRMVLDRIVEIKRKISLRPLPEDNPNFDGSNPTFSLLTGAIDQGTMYPQDRWIVTPVMGGPGDGFRDANSDYDILPPANNDGNPGTSPVPYDSNYVIPGWNAADKWDVDNDHDGTPDSIWIDLGFPVQVGDDGRLFKPLFAMLVRDLDGRLNLNAHGNRFQTQSRYVVDEAGALAPSPIAAAQPVDAPAPYAGSATLVQGTLALPRGRGYGPAEIYFGHIFEPGPAGPALGEFQQTISTRYSGNVAPGVSFGQGDPRSDDVLSRVRTVGTPQNYSLQLSAYSSPPDVWGRGALGLDHFGQPVTRYMAINAAGLYTETEDDPYEFKLTERAHPQDRPYTLAQLERLLRWPDIDAQSLPDRLIQTAHNSFNSPAKYQQRALVTTDSRHIPIPNIQVPEELRGSLGAESSILDLYIQKLTAGSAPSIAAQLRVMVPFEIRNGKPMNLNRPFGNGFDDPSDWDGDGNINGRDGVVDDPRETALPEESWPNLRAGSPPQPPANGPPNFIGIPFDYVNDDPLASGIPVPLRTRQIFARHLYCLMMLVLTAPEDSLGGYFDTAPANNVTETAHVVAQWVINVVDFRDADSIMTPFEYDINPWNGWDVDDNFATPDATTERRVVWGCERPELLITETLAWHDRRDEDLSSPEGDTDDPENDARNDFDQRLIPRGAFFVELFNPWTVPQKPWTAANQRWDGGSHAPGEFCDFIPANGVTEPGVRLNRVNRRGSPVWRMLVAGGASMFQNGAVGGNPALPRDPDDRIPTPPGHALPGNEFDIDDVDRAVYFAPPPGQPPGTTWDNPSVAVQITDIPLGRSYHSDNDNNSNPDNFAPLLPGRYAVIGSAGQDIDGDGQPDGQSFAGRRTDADEAIPDLRYGATRRVVLSPDPNPDVQQVAVLNNYDPVNDTPPITDPAAGDIQAAIAIPVNSPRNLTITEPNGGYSLGVGPNGETYDPTLGGGEGAYNPPLDEPLDANRTDWARFGQEDYLETDGTKPTFRVVYLQRLANPLEAWHVSENPYRTIDSSWVDLHVFSGVTTEQNTAATMPTPFEFYGLMRGESDTSTPFARNLWLTESLKTPPGSDLYPEAVAEHYFSFIMRHTLGYLNQKYHPYFTSATAPSAPYVGAPNTSGGAGNPRAFPWLNWNNRPFASPFEIMQVPVFPPARLLQEMDDTTALGPPFTMGGEAVGANRNPVFSRLLNFFHSDSSAGATPTRLYRLFDFVETPSPFVDAERVFNPQGGGHYGNAVLQPAASSVSGFPPGGASGFRPPHNKFSRFRDVGKINLNTIFDSQVFSGLMKGYPAMDPNAGSTTTWDEFIASRRKVTPTTGGAIPPDPLLPDPAIPTVFANPFRTAASAAELAPLPSMEIPADEEIQATLFRTSSNGVSPLFASTPTTPYDNVNRNSHFRYHGLSRLANLTTTHSNVYAVWITVGFFEVTPTRLNQSTIGGPNPVQSDGYLLGQELGIDTGQVKRHRAFYIIDRSIPVAFEPGYNHNVDRAVLIRRFIE